MLAFAKTGNLSYDDSDGNENVKQKTNSFIKQNNNFARASHFFVHFFAVTIRLQSTGKCLVISRFMEGVDKRRWTYRARSPQKSTPGAFAYIWHFQRIRMAATKFEKMRIRFILKRNVFAAIFDVVAKALYYLSRSADRKTEQNWSEILCRRIKF